MEVVTKEDLKEFRLLLLEDLRQLLNQAGKKEHLWLRSSEVRKLLKISAGTLQTMRINGTLHPSKLSGIWYYSKEEIESLLVKPP